MKWWVFFLPEKMADKTSQSRARGVMNDDAGGGVLHGLGRCVTSWVSRPFPAFAGGGRRNVPLDEPVPRERGAK